MQFEEWWKTKGELIFKDSMRSAYTAAKAACKEAYDEGARPASPAVEAKCAEADWARNVIAQEMGADAPLRDQHPLRGWLRELNEARRGGWQVAGVGLEPCRYPDAPTDVLWQELERRNACKAEVLLVRLQQHGGNLRELAEAGLVAVKKGEDYNTGFGRDDYFPLGLASYAQMLWVKALRVVSFAKQPRPPNNEAVRDTLLDMMNYASFGADWLRRQPAATFSTRADCGEPPRWNYPAPINETKKEG